MPVVCNGDFESALDAWTVSVSEDAEATVAATPATSFDGLVCAYAEVTSPGAHRPQFNCRVAEPGGSRFDIRRECLGERDRAGPRVQCIHRVR